MRRDINQQDIEREAVECLDTVMEERAMRRDGDWERTLNYVRKGERTYDTVTWMLAAIFAVTAIAVGFWLGVKWQ